MHDPAPARDDAEAPTAEPAARPPAGPALAWALLDPVIERALLEDLAGGDPTSEATVPLGQRAHAELVAKQALRFCGGPLLAAVFGRLAAGLGPVEVELLAAEGRDVEPGTAVARLWGSARALLAGERTALNLVQRACGVATLTARYVEAAGPALRVTDTRKTMPGLRALDRYAVRCGGGASHRDDLGGAILIKENHVRCAGSVTAAIRAARAAASHTLRVGCEVTELAELDEALQAGADWILLDNMDDAQLARAVARAGGRVPLEVSGGVTLERLPTLARLGVDVVSVGALTHSAPAADLSLLFRPT